MFGEFRAPTGVGGSSGRHGQLLDNVVEFVKTIAGGPPRLLVAKPGLDGHSSGAEQIAVRARDCGMDITYEGIRLTPEEIVTAAHECAAHVVGLSILSGSHIALVKELMERMHTKGLSHIPVIVGGIIPNDDANRLRDMGVARVYTPKDFELNTIMTDIVMLAEPKSVALQ